MKVMGFVNFPSLLMTNKSQQVFGIRVKVMSNGSKNQIPNQWTEGKKKQIEEYLDFTEDLEFSIAIATDDIIKTVSQLRARGVEFYQRHHIHYQAIPDVWETHGCMMKRYQWDRKISNYGRCWWRRIFIANFTKPVQDRPTCFFEIIQRMGLKALVRVTLRLIRSIEREQDCETL
jgi:4-hydroxyphenylpyruvate dioxygenase